MLLDAGLEVVPNVAESRRPTVIAALASACGPALLDVHRDPDHDRTVFTLAGTGPADAPDDPGPPDVTTAICALADAVVAATDLAEHPGGGDGGGVHPRVGLLDVVPFVALDGGADGRALAAEAARAFGAWLAARHELPVFLYDDADASRRTLPELRRTAFATRRPDVGPDAPHPRLGATAVGAREPLVAVNCLLAGDDLGGARRIAAQVRERDGGLPGVRALGFPLATRGRAQVSMNVTRLAECGVEEACRTVEQLAPAAGTAVTEIELVGLVPAAEHTRWSAGFVARSGIGVERTIEARLASVARG